MTDSYPRGRDASHALTEVRTVLSRAETARDALGRRWFEGDPDAADMRAALDAVVALLDRWRRTGRRPAR